MIPLLLLRPQPGNDASAARARALGLDVVQIPLFGTVRAEAGPVPAGPFDALLLTSANGVRHGAEVLEQFADIPLYAVGEATAEVARKAGHRNVLTGGGDAASTAAMIAADGHIEVLHLCGAEVRSFDPHGLSVTRHVVYRAVERDEDAVRASLEGLDPAVAAIHSPRAGRRFAALMPIERRNPIFIAAISPAALEACGSGWAGTAVSASPDDTALLACAEALCIRAG